MPTITYIYGPTGCGKTRMLHEVFDEIVARGPVGTNRNFSVNYEFTSADAEDLKFYMRRIDPLVSDTLFIVLCGNEQPDNINIHMDHIFYIERDQDLMNARNFFNYVTTSSYE